MLHKKKEHPPQKTELHPRNKHRERYNFTELIQSTPELVNYVSLNKYGDESIDFFDPKAVKTLNKSLLTYFYKIDHWDIPENYLCPPIPGRADYIHYMADILANTNNGKMPHGLKIKCLDIGVGANCIYPILGTIEYGWSFVGSDIDPVALQSAKNIVELNPALKGKIELRSQLNAKNIFNETILKDELFDLSICNPPFHSSLAESQAGTQRKLKNLKGIKENQPILNFGGQNNELWCNGGEERFVKDMIFQSRKFADSCCWFSTLVSKQANLKGIYASLSEVNAVDVKTITMGQGNKISRIVAWTFLNTSQHKKWTKTRW